MVMNSTNPSESKDKKLLHSCTLNGSVSGMKDVNLKSLWDGGKKACEMGLE